MLYHWIGINLQGECIEGRSLSLSPQRLQKRFAQKGWRLASVSPMTSPFFKKKSLSFKDLAILTYQVHQLMKAGLPIMKALSQVQSSLPPKSRPSYYIQDTLSALAEGKSIGEAFSKNKSYWGAMTCLSLQHADQSLSGDLTGAWGRIRTWAESCADIRQNIIKAITYPLIVLGMAFIIFLLMLWTIIPSFVELFEAIQGPNTQLPLCTEYLLNFSASFREHPVAFGLGFILVAALTYSTLKSKATKKIALQLSLRVPWLRSIVAPFFTLRFFEGLHLLLKSGLSLPKALNALKELDLFLESNALCERALRTLNEGRKLSEWMLNEPLFSRLSIQWIQSTENTGQLAATLEQLTIYERETLENRIKSTLALLEPLLILGLAIGIGIFVALLFLPIWTLVDNLQ
jgi:type IV pilus assembly protein PilC